jgi:hypothetical protein
MQIEVDPLGVQQEAEQIDQAAAKAIHRPDGNHTDLTAADRLEEPSHRGGLSRGLAPEMPFVIADNSDGPAAPRCERPEARGPGVEV